jgi:hypothetical protein
LVLILGCMGAERRSCDRSGVRDFARPEWAHFIG